SYTLSNIFTGQHVNRGADECGITACVDSTRCTTGQAVAGRETLYSVADLGDIQMAKTVRFHGFGGPEVLRLQGEMTAGEPGAGEVRIGVRAIGLNRIEALFRAGHFVTPTFPSRIGYEAAGVIEAVGPGVRGFGPADRVAVLFGLSMETYGTYGETILYPA